MDYRSALIEMSDLLHVASGALIRMTDNSLSRPDSTRVQPLLQEVEQIADRLRIIGEQISGLM